MNRLMNLKNQKMQYIKRSCDLVDIGFGDLLKRKNRKNEEVLVARYSLHIQCPFKILYNQKMLTEHTDLYVSSANVYETVDIGQKNCTLFDQRLQEYTNELSDEYVVDVSINQIGNITISLSNITIFVFIDSTTKEEQWRFFETGTNKEHLIR